MPQSWLSVCARPKETSQKSNARLSARINESSGWQTSEILLGFRQSNLRHCFLTFSSLFESSPRANWNYTKVHKYWATFELCKLSKHQCFVWKLTLVKLLSNFNFYNKTLTVLNLSNWLFLTCQKLNLKKCCLSKVGCQNWHILSCFWMG